MRDIADGLNEAFDDERTEKVELEAKVLVSDELRVVLDAAGR